LTDHGAGPADAATSPHPGDHAIRLLDQVPVAALALDADLRVVHANAEARGLLGLSGDDVAGRTPWDGASGALGTELDAACRQCRRTGEPVQVVQYDPSQDRWHDVTVRPGPTGLDLVLADVTESRRAAPVTAERAGAWGVRLLTEVTEALTATLDAEEGVRRLARLVVPRLGHWGIVSLVDEEGLHDMAVVHHDPARQHHADAYADARVAVLTPASPVRRSLATGSLVQLGAGDEASVDLIADTIVDDPRVSDLLRDLRTGSMVTIPLWARGRIAGLLSLYRDAGTAPWTPDELAVVQEIAARAGLALDNARLYAERRETALVLQEAMLTPLPEPDHLELRARYVPAARDEKVGGDWYDALTLRSGATALVIGDLTGHDIGAAATMGQVRTVLRTLAWEHGGSPATVLTRLDHALAGLGVDALATCLLATVEQAPEEATRGLRRLRWSSAGHLFPVVLNPDGTVELLEVANDPMLGLDEGTVRHDHERLMSPGTTLVLYTDGLVERRESDLTTGMESLCQALARHRDAPLDELLTALVTDLGGGPRRDDIAMLAVRFHAEDRPRPPEAGPNRGNAVTGQSPSRPSATNPSATTGGSSAGP
jgi:serine phosphatase RsbU (regulator of sigma subunit)